MRNGVQLIAYADRFGGQGLAGLHDLLTGPLAGAFSGVHILPFFDPYDGADAGFDPIDHRNVDRRLGDWGDVETLATAFDVTVDLIVNHISDRSAEYADYRERGSGSPHALMFLRYGSVFPDGATSADLLVLYRPRPGLPFTAVTLADGSRRLMWTTFGGNQIDIDVSDPAARSYLTDVLDRFSEAGISQVRLDAVGYAVKTPGTSSFMTPETFEFVDELGEEVHRLRMEVLVEVHAHHEVQREAAKHADRVYDFGLPPLVLHAFSTGSGAALRRWLEDAPRNVVTVLDTHDGIGIIDAGPAGDVPGLLEPDEVDVLVAAIHEATGGESRRATGESATNLDLYQVNSTYWSALGGDDERYLAARVIQFFSPGIPQVYYAGLLAAPNDMEGLARTGVGRDINRPFYDMSAVERELERPVVQRLLRLCRFRTEHEAFGGSFSLSERTPDHELVMRWDHGEHWAEATVDLEQGTFTVASSPGPKI